MQVMSLRVAVVTAAAVGLLLASTPVTADDSADLYLVQGLPGVTADVAIDGDVVASGVDAAKVVGPISVPAGTHTVVVSAGGAQLVSATTSLEAGDSMDLVVHLPTDPQGTPVVTSFDNDVSAVPRGKARIAVAHTAAVGPADIKVDGKVLFANVANGEELSLVVPADTYSVQIVPTGRDTPSVLGPVDLPVKAGGLNRVYAFGDPTTTTMNVAAHVIMADATGSASPERVDSGLSGAADPTSSNPLGSVPFFTG